MSGKSEEQKSSRPNIRDGISVDALARMMQSMSPEDVAEALRVSPHGRQATDELLLSFIGVMEDMAKGYSFTYGIARQTILNFQNLWETLSAIPGALSDLTTLNFSSIAEVAKTLAELLPDSVQEFTTPFISLAEAIFIVEVRLQEAIDSAPVGGEVERRLKELSGAIGSAGDPTPG